MADASCTNPDPKAAEEALTWVVKALRTERVLKALRRDECGVIRED